MKSAREAYQFELQDSLSNHSSLIRALHGSLQVCLLLFLSLLLLSDFLKVVLLIGLACDCIALLLSDSVPKSRPALAVLHSLDQTEHSTTWSTANNCQAEMMTAFLNRITCTRLPSKVGCYQAGLLVCFNATGSTKRLLLAHGRPLACNCICGDARDDTLYSFFWTFVTRTLWVTLTISPFSFRLQMHCRH